MDEVVGEGASVLAESHPPGEERTQLEAVDIGLTQFDQADRRGEADYYAVDKGSSSLSFPSGFDASAPDLFEASEPLVDVSSTSGDGTDGGRVAVIDVDDTENPQCERATGCMTGLPVPQGSAAPPLSNGGTEKAIAYELDSSKIAVVDADTLQEEGKAESDHILHCHQVKNDEQVGTLMPQGPADVSNCDFDGGNPKIPVSEADTIISSHATASAVSSDMEVSKMEVDTTTISQHCKDSFQGEAVHSQGASAVFPFNSDGVKFSSFESDNGISAIANVDVVEEAVLKMEVDSFPVSEWQQGKEQDSIKEEDSVKEEVLVPQSSYIMPSSGFDGDLLNCDAFEITDAPTTAAGDNLVHFATLKVDVDTEAIAEGKQVTCEESDVLRHVSSISESAPEKVEPCEPVSVAMPGDNDAMKVDMTFTDIDQLGNGTLPICEQTVDVVVADISMSKDSSSEFPFDSDHGLQDISVHEPDVTTISLDSADVVDDEAMQMDGDDRATILQRGGRRKRGRPSKTQVGRTSRQKEAEEVCFICFDGGDLVVCDRRGCSKVYHPSCVNRDEAFFCAKGRWTCGWHICSSCERTAHYMCFSFTYSLCKGCIQESGFICLRENKGFCEACMSTVMLIETKEYGNGQMITVDFDDRSSFEYLFKDYYIALKAKLSLTLDELMSARNPIKKSDVATLTNGSGNLRNPREQQVASSDSSSDHKERTSRRKIRKRSKKFINDKGSVKGDYVGTSVSRNSEWATDELLEFVAHMRNGDISALSQFDVQALLLDYIKKHNLRDRRRKSQIVCDPRLGNLFGKERVGHFEMLKLLESHFLIKEVTTLDSEDKQGGIVDPDSDPANAKANNDPSTKLTLDKRHKVQKKVEDKELLNNLDDYAAVDVHNISLMYLRRNLMENLIEDDEFEEKAIGSFVRIRISGLGQWQDMYRLVQVIGSGKATEQYKSGKGMTDVTLEILNLNKKEIITIDIISNQEFTEEECKRLRQSIKCGFIGRLTVGEVLEKAMSLQHVRVNDWLESEKSRLGHLHDRASEKGRRKELRECVEKLQLLNTPEERDRRLNEAPDIHTDPHMDPDFESAEEEEADVGKHDFYDKLRESSFTRNGREVKSPGKGGSTENWSSFRKNSNVCESNSSQIQVRPLSDSFSGRRVDATDFSLNQSNDTHQLVSEVPKNCVLASAPDGSLYNEKHLSMEQSSEGPHGNQKASLPVGNVTKSNTSESETIWHYKDPSARIQGPFSMSQLCKWSTTGYFPPNLMIWRTSDKPEDSITLTDAMAGKFEKDLPEWEPPSKNTEDLVDVSPTSFSVEGNSESVRRGSKENTQKVKPSSWSSTNVDAPSSTSPNAANIRVGQGQKKSQLSHSLIVSTM
ncbi:zinc finger CCCH domain-containing protein 19-like isoform X1 [Zingiber officinale]|uniref:zinc finger CCCH domain-containing protein 19-like isoform X1 n=1 Tax=Zingiber officinale TaxID=94328 RepID=UPI001C4B08AA|nr:zinc finger CCCH domain-containing protein 19-like isoform X1 [Zingiber officinale]